MYKNICESSLSDEDKEKEKLKLSKKAFIKYDMTKVNIIDVQAMVYLSDTNIKYPKLKDSEEWFLGWRGASFEETVKNAQNENAVIMKKDNKTGEMKVKELNFFYLTPDEAYSYACVTGNTVIETPLGDKQIKDLKVGDYVSTPLGARKVIGFYEQGLRETVKISSSKSSFICTNNHKVAVNTVLGPRYVEAKDLNSRGTFYFGKEEILDFDLYYNNHKSNSINIPYSMQDFELCYYLLGLLFADGSRQQGRMDLKLSIKDKQILEDIQIRIKSVSKLRVRESKSPSSDNICKSLTLSLCSKYFQEFLDFTGYNTTKDKRDYMNIPDEYFNDFLRGYYDGDGSSNGYNICLFTHYKFTKHLIQDLERLYNIKPSKVYNKLKVDEMYFTREDSVKLYKIMYNNSSICLKRKRDRTLKEKKTFVEITYLDSNKKIEFSGISSASRYTGIDTSSLSRVKLGKRKKTHGVICKAINKISYTPYTRKFDNIKIEKNKKLFVYDIQVEETHNFILKGGVISHNCVDSLGTYLLYYKTLPFLQEAKISGQLDIKCLMPLTRFENELTLIDTEMLKKYSNTLDKKIKEVQERCWNTAGREFNLGSSKDCNTVLKSLNIHTGVTTKRGEMSTSKDSIKACLERLSENDPARQFLEDLTSYGTYTKQKSSYMDNVIELAETNEHHKGRLRFAYKTCEVPSGRFAAGGDKKTNFFSTINIQNITKPHTANHFCLQESIVKEYYPEIIEAIDKSGSREECDTPLTILDKDKLNQLDSNYVVEGNRHSYRIRDWVFSDKPFMIPNTEEYVVEGFNQDLNIRSAFLPDDGYMWTSCLGLDTKVEIETGEQVPITFFENKENRLNHKIRTLKGYSSVTAYMNKGKKQKCILTTKSGLTINCTKDHKFLVIDEEGFETWKEFKDILETDYIISNREV